MPAITLAPPLSEASITSAGHVAYSYWLHAVEFCANSSSPKCCEMPESPPPASPQASDIPHSSPPALVHLCTKCRAHRRIPTRAVHQTRWRPCASTSRRSSASRINGIRRSSGSLSTRRWGGALSERRRRWCCGSLPGGRRAASPPPPPVLSIVFVTFLPPPGPSPIPASPACLNPVSAAGCCRWCCFGPR